MSTPISQLEPVISINQRYQRMKRGLDLCVTLLLLPAFGLITLLVALLIRIDSPGYIFFRQKRVGQDGEEFYLYKFRSMYENSNDQLHREDIKRYMQGEAISTTEQVSMAYKRINDPRVTRVGKFLRKSSIDELPQLLNVLKGEMSLVGPRPPLPYEVEQYSPYDRLRLSGKPGLTGPWQVYGRSRVTFQTMIEMDVAYLQRQSIWEDIKLIVLTIPVMLRGWGGA